jgi:hypothetical protein
MGVSMKLYFVSLYSSSLTLILLTWTIWRAPTNASKWRMGFNSAFEGITLILLTWTIWRAPTNASKWRMGFNSAFEGLTCRVNVTLLCVLCVCHCTTKSTGISLPSCTLVSYHFTVGHYSGYGPTECIQGNLQQCVRLVQLHFY